VTHADALLQRGEPDQEARRQCRSDLSEAIAIHQELVELAWYNEHASNFAGALENLASDHEVFARLKRGGGYSTAPLREAAKALERAVAAYRAGDQEGRVAAAEQRLSALRLRMRE
jgi:exonuclease VII small subunit